MRKTVTNRWARRILMLPAFCLYLAIGLAVVAYMLLVALVCYLLRQPAPWRDPDWK